MRTCTVPSMKTLRVSLWALAYSHMDNPDRSVDLIRIDSLSGTILEVHTYVYSAAPPLTPAGLAYRDHHLYVFNYSEESGIASTLTVVGCQ